MVNPKKQGDGGSEDFVVLIHRTRQASHYVQIANSLARDERLSYRSLGILVYLLSRTPEWRCWVPDLIRRTGGRGDGRDGIRSSLRQLRELGFASLVRQRLSNGRFRSVYHVFDDPAKNDQQDIGLTIRLKPETAEPSPVDPALEQPASEKAVTYEDGKKQKTTATKTATTNTTTRASAYTQTIAIANLKMMGVTEKDIKAILNRKSPPEIGEVIEYVRQRQAEGLIKQDARAYLVTLLYRAFSPPSL